MLQLPAIARAASYPVVARAVIGADVLDIREENTFPQPVVPLLEGDRSAGHLVIAAACLITQRRHHPGGDPIDGSVPCHSPAHAAVVLVGIHHVGQPHGLLIRHARHSSGLLLNPLQCRHQNRHQYGNDCDHD